MAMSCYSSSKQQKRGSLNREDEELISTLPRERGWLSPYIYQFQGTWYPDSGLRGLLACRRHFEALSTDLFLVTTPKSGTTWLKALVFTIANRKRCSYAQHQLLTASPHDLVSFVELGLYLNNQSPNLTSIPSPRLFATHMSFVSLPQSVRDSNCRIVYLCRNPRDTFVSLWFFKNKMTYKIQEPSPIEEEFEMFLSGKSIYGPFWDHVLGYWKESKRNPQKVLFMHYEEMKREPELFTKKLAEFMGSPISPEEEREGTLKEIIKLCSFKNLSSLAVNKTGRTKMGTDCNMFFRRGDVGDWINHLSPTMVERLDQLLQEKLHASGLSFQYS
ncbi:cytosolic sulfotransferase 12-like [Aristolochia californica]|uniref:cytosolic sulfotransferase 12-like n=1 Tax=Aristolochia californica TaxID=171875 RepID=UPI0035D7740F